MGIEKKAALICVVVVALLFGIGLANREHRPDTETARATLGPASSAIILPAGAESSDLGAGRKERSPAPTPGPAEGGDGGRNVGGDALPGFREVVVLARDNYWKIAERELGDAAQFQRIADANPGVDPRRLRVGQKLRVPAVATATRPQADANRPREEATNPAAGREYRIRKDETLSSIAERVYGKSSRWRDIWAANRTRIPDPRRMRAGLTIVLP